MESVEDDGYTKLLEKPNYVEVIKLPTHGQGEWMTNSKGHAVNFKAKYLKYVPKVWHHFITLRILPNTNICEVTKERALLNYAILQDIKFDIVKIIEEVI